MSQMEAVLNEAILKYLEQFMVPDSCGSTVTNPMRNIIARHVKDMTRELRDAGAPV